LGNDQSKESKKNLSGFSNPERNDCSPGRLTSQKEKEKRILKTEPILNVQLINATHVNKDLENHEEKNDKVLIDKNSPHKSHTNSIYHKKFQTAKSLNQVFKGFHIPKEEISIPSNDSAYSKRRHSTILEILEMRRNSATDLDKLNI